MSAARVVCLAGRSGAGKDTAGDHLVRRHAFERVAVADPLKEAVAQLFRLSRAQLWGDERDRTDARLGRTPRELYQWFGTACVEADPDVWLRPFLERVTALVSRGGSVVCTDLRTPRELDAARALGASIWLIERPGAGAPGEAAGHPTETALTGAPRDCFDRVIRNDGTRAELERRVSESLRD